jgi:hypothetical protein
VGCLLAVCAGAGYLISQQQPARSGSALTAAPYQDSGTRTSAFLVTDTDTSYLKSTLRTQVRDRIAEQASGQAVQPTQTDAGPPSAGPATPPPGLTPRAPRGPAGESIPADTGGGDIVVSGDATGGGASPSGNQGGVAPGTEVTPSRSLVGCVMHLTGDTPPEFVDRATYQYEPVYVIVVPDEAWVVGIGCTAARPALITSVRLGATG